MEKLGYIIAGIFFILMLIYRYWYIFHKRMHNYYKEEAKKNFNDFTTVVKDNYEIQNKLDKYENS